MLIACRGTLRFDVKTPNRVFRRKNLMYVNFNLLMSVAERSKARVCGRSLAGTAGSNLAGGMGVCLL